MVRAMAQGTAVPVRKTGQGMVRLPKDNHVFTRSRARIFALLGLISCMVILTMGGLAWAAERDKVIEESGIRYPDGFDLNTVGEVEGKASGFYRPEKGPSSFYLATRKEVYIVIASPVWYWDDLGATINDGEEVRVVGSKALGKDGNLYIIAQEMKLLTSGQSLVFRGKDGSALWKASIGGSAGGRGGFGGSGGGKGGIGGGSGGTGRGRR